MIVTNPLSPKRTTSTMTAKRVLSIGQCFADHSSIRRTLSGHFGVEVVPAATAAEARETLREQTFALILVNRVLDGDGSSGVEVIRQLRADEELRPVPVMLVSNYEDAQRQAVAQGALPGFGKAALGQPQMLGRLRAILG
jgi:two-component system chemotaxis response regulator CheY